MANKKLIKNITTDELAVMMKNSLDTQTKLMLDSFDKVNERIDKMDTRIDKIDTKLSGIATKEDVKNLNKKLDSLNDNLVKNNKLETRVDYIENVLAIKKD